MADEKKVAVKMLKTLAGGSEYRRGVTSHFGAGEAKRLIDAGFAEAADEKAAKAAAKAAE